MQYKIIISIVAVALTFIGYVPYFIDIFKKKTTPHTFTWLIWTITGLIGYGLQVAGGAGVGSWTLLAASVICLFIFILSLRNGKKDIVKLDVVFFILALVALFLWVVVKQPIWSAILITIVDFLGFLPTVRKSWNKPYSETLFLYELCTVRHALSLFALSQFNILTALYVGTWSLLNFIFSIILIIRRKKFPKPQSHGL